MSAETLHFGGQVRSYQLYVPKSYDGTRNAPLVLNFHGYGSNAVQQMLYANFGPLADEHDFLVVAPDGQGARRHFNLTGEAGLQNDIAMVAKLLTHVERILCVDTRRVFSTGMSDGGAMTSVLACLMYTRIAAFAPVAVIINRAGCGGKTPVSIMGFQGTADPVVPFNGGAVNCCGGARLGAAPVAMAAWAAHDGCNPQFTDTRVGTEVRRREWTGCDGSSAAVFYIIDGGGHTWPGAIPIASLGKTTNQIKASELIWNFFAAHPLASAPTS